MPKDNFITLNLKTRIKQILFGNTYIPPELFFAFVLLKQINLFQIPQRLDWLFYTGVAMLLLSCFNCYLFYLGVLNNLGILAPFNLIIGILSSNQKYKLYLAVFTVVYYLPITQSRLQQISIILLCMLICAHTFNQMIFPNKKQNMWFYCGFFSVGFLQVYVFMLVNFGIDVGIYQKLWMGVVLGALGWIVIHMRISRIMKKEQTFKNVGIVALKVTLLLQQFKTSQNIRSYLFSHKHNCKFSNCFCSDFPWVSTSSAISTISLPPPQQIINFIFLNHFQQNSWQIEERQSITHHYIDFLIQCNHFVQAMQILIGIDKRKLGFFGMCQHWRVAEKLRTRLEKDIYFDKLDRKMEYIRKYDMQLGFINKEIRQILKDKAEFWKQLCKQNPILFKLQINGRKLVKRIEYLHEYFMLKMRPCEEALSFFKCTFIYASYLLLSTNYVELANSLTKKSQKILEENKGHPDNGKQFGIFLEITQQKQLGGKAKEFQLIITNISSSLCAFLGKQKQDLLNSTLAEMIPNQFLFLHDIGFNNFVKTKDFQKSNSVLIGKTLQLPFKINGDHAIFLHLSSELRFDPITSKPTVQCMLKKMTNDAVQFIMNLDGKLLYRQSELFKDFSHHYSVKNALEKMKLDFERESIFQKLQTQVEEEENIIKVQCIPLFSNKLIIHNKEPLIKVVLKSDNFKNQKIKIENLDNSNKVKQHASLDRERIAKQTDSQASNSSRRDSIQNVLSNLMEANSLRKQPFLTLILIGLGVVSIVCFIFVRDFFRIWDTSKKQETPSYTIMIMINMKTIFNLVINQKYDLLRNYTDPDTKVRIRYALHEGKTQQQYIEGLFAAYLGAEKVYLYQALFGANNEVSKKSKQFFQKQITITNPQFPSMGIQNMTLQGLIVNMVTSIHYSQLGMNFHRLLLYFVYLPIFHKEFTDIINVCIEDVRNKIREVRKKNIIMITLVDVCILLFFAPIWVFNWRNKKQHFKIYNLFASLQAKLIIHEIKKLQTIDSQIFAHSNKSKNTNESSNKVSSFGEVNKTQKLNQKDNQRIDILKQNQNQKQNGLTYTTRAINIGKIRKRGADLDIKNSDCDKMKFICSDSIPMWFMLTFFVICNTVFFNKYGYIDTVEDQFQKSIGVMSYVEDMNIAIVNTKRYIDEYTNDRRIAFQQQDLQDWIKNWLLKTEFKQEFQIGMQSQIQNCTTQNLICSRPHSMLLLQGVVKKTISDGFEAQKAYLRENSTQNFLIMQKSRQALVYSTFLLNEFGVRYNGWLIENFIEFESNQLEINGQITTKSTIFWVFLAIFSISSVIYTMFRKNNYVTEVTLLSLLSKEMLFNNKSVESFVHRLSKSLR